MEERKKIYIYNKVQALYYINQFKCKVIDYSVHKDTGNVFMVFDKADCSKAYDSWCNKCNEYKNTGV